MRNRVVTAHIPLDLTEQVDLLAVRIDPPKGWIVRQALTSLIEFEGKHRRPGRCRDHASVTVI